jgi:cobalt-zinc-cadmium efflux system outer membrane protein
MPFRTCADAGLRAFALLAVLSAPAAAQRVEPALSLDSSVQLALRAHPRVSAARAALQAAEARSRQASARLNPTLSWAYERTTRAGAENSQHITTLEQPIAHGQRAARQNTAAAEEQVAVAELRSVQQEITLLTVTAYASALEAERREQIAARSAATFAEAMRVVSERLAAGDASGYEQRRIQLEAARYAVVREARAVEFRRALRGLLALIDPSNQNLERTLALSFDAAPLPEWSNDSLLELGRVQRPDLQAAEARVMVREAQSRLAASQRIPVPTLVGGYKSETAAGLGALRGIAAGVSIPLPLFDRRQGARDAAAIDITQARMELVDRQQRATLEILSAADAARSAELQLVALRPALGENAERALVAVNTAYAEGEISLDAWLLALRAYDEVEEAYATLRADAMVRRAELARAIGQPSLY